MKHLSKLMFSSQSTEWATPQGLFDQLDQEFTFDMDVCAVKTNAKCKNYLDANGIWSGLAVSWQGTCWMNPPYGRQIGKWVQKAFESSMTGATVVCLLPSRTDTRWWHDYVMQAHEIRFIKGRLRFGNAKTNAPFPSAIVVFKPMIMEVGEA